MFNWVLNMSLFPVKNKETNYLTRKIWPLFMEGFNCLRATEPQQEDNLLFTTQSPGIPVTHLIEFGSMKG